ncbi:hypothetical protein E2C01_082994 [Portunus trituberculatus]|uniref:Uncharacterized protein n=1 Tax=Portunus trituberculatus TaxID=210409 RepID=A0A5B7IW06_PORTR|nr:hypothetical protein [Portunus trituberculatus]
MLFILGRIYGGQRINGQSLYYFNPPHEFLKLHKNQIVSRINLETRHSTEGVKQVCTEEISDRCGRRGRIKTRSEIVLALWTLTLFLVKIQTPGHGFPFGVFYRREEKSMLLFVVLLFQAAVVQWNHACFGVRGISKRTGSNPVHGPSVD